MSNLKKKAVPRPVDRLEAVAAKLEKLSKHFVPAKLSATASPPAIVSAKDGPRFTRYAADGSVVLNGGEAARDATTGLIWTLEAINDGTEYAWSAARKAASEIRLLKRTDWRLPTIREQLSIVNYERYCHALEEIFRVPRTGWAWTLTKDAEDPESYAWYLYLYDGDAGRYYQSLRGVCYRRLWPRSFRRSVTS